MQTLDSLSVGTREQLASLVRLAIAKYVGTALLLDDQLVHSDEHRLRWFGGELRRAAREIQIIVFTCRPSDYLEPDEIAASEAPPDWEAGGITTIDLARAIRGEGQQPPR
jgi:uncharacterized protein YhaN